MDWGNRLSGYAEAMPFWVEHIPARLLIARGNKESAAKQLQGCYQKAVQADAQGLVIAIRIYQLVANTNAEALDFLTEALSLGQPEGFFRSFVDEGRLLAPLLKQAILQGIESEYAAKLLTIIAERKRAKSRIEKE